MEKAKFPKKTMLAPDGDEDDDDAGGGDLDDDGGDDFGDALSVLDCGATVADNEEVRVRENMRNGSVDRKEMVVSMMTTRSSSASSRELTLHAIGVIVLIPVLSRLILVVFRR
jgi:hypothetical protein